MSEIVYESSVMCVEMARSRRSLEVTCQSPAIMMAQSILLALVATIGSGRGSLGDRYIL